MNYNHHSKYNQSSSINSHHPSTKLGGSGSHGAGLKSNKVVDGRFKNEHRSSTGQFIRGSSATVDSRRAHPEDLLASQKGARVASNARPTFSSHPTQNIHSSKNPKIRDTKKLTVAPAGATTSKDLVRRQDFVPV